MKVTEKILFALGVLFIVMGLPIFIGGLTGGFYDPPKESLREAIGITLIMGAMPLAGGLLLCWKMRKNGQKRVMDEEERAIIQLAKKSGGKITVAEVELATKMSMQEAKQLLERCALNGIAEMEITETGGKVFCFYGISDDEKRNSERI
jgi:hypothetical protein